MINVCVIWQILSGQELSLSQEWSMNAHKCALCAKNSPVFLMEVSKNLLFFFSFFFLETVIPLDRTWHLERSVRRICLWQPQITVAHREQGGIEEENGSCLFKCHFYEVNAWASPFLRALHGPFSQWENISCHVLFCMSFGLAQAALLAVGFKPCEASPTSWH